MNNIEEISKHLRHLILKSTSEAGSGHTTSSLSAVELMSTLFFGGVLKYKVDNPKYRNNDRVIFSKGHAAPLLYSLWKVAGVIDEKEILSLRKFESDLEGHPTPNFPYAEAATGSLGQGLSIGAGMALSAKLDELSFRTYVLLGDSEITEGQNWEAMQLASRYKLDNFVGILDVNRLGQRGETMHGHKLNEYSKKIKAFGWHVEEVDGHNVGEIQLALEQSTFIKDKPTMIVAKTIKGRGVSFLEDKDGWHGKALNKDELERALDEVGEIDSLDIIKIQSPEEIEDKKDREIKDGKLKANCFEDKISTRKAYGYGLLTLGENNPNMVVLDAEVSNSTYAEMFREKYSDRFFEMYIAEQNMVSVATGMALMGKIPFVSTFAAFFTRAFDQIRMGNYSEVSINFVGSHAGVSIGQDGSSQMGLEDISMFRSIFGSTVIYPSDCVSTQKLMEEIMNQKGVCYLRTTRMEMENLYDSGEDFGIGGSKILRNSDGDEVTILGAGVTLHESLKAYDVLIEEGIKARVIDIYSIKPIDTDTLVKACKETKTLVVVEDHYAEGGIAEAIRSALVHESTPIYSLAVRRLPRSGKPEELLEFEEIDSQAIVKKVKEAIGR